MLGFPAKKHVARDSCSLAAKGGKHAEGKMAEFTTLHFNDIAPISQYVEF